MGASGPDSVPSADLYCPRAVQGWPEVMSHEVLELFHKTVAGVYVGLGQSVGMTLLPQPPAEMLASLAAQRPLPIHAPVAACACACGTFQDGVGSET